MKTNLDIKVQIAGRPYSLSIATEEERVVRKAAEEVSQTIRDYSKAFEYKDHQDLFAMVALQHAANSIRLEEEKSFREHEMKEKLLAALDKSLEQLKIQRQKFIDNSLAIVAKTIDKFYAWHLIKTEGRDIIISDTEYLKINLH